MSSEQAFTPDDVQRMVAGIDKRTEEKRKALEADRKAGLVSGQQGAVSWLLHTADRPGLQSVMAALGIRKEYNLVELAELVGGHLFSSVLARSAGFQEAYASAFSGTVVEAGKAIEVEREEQRRASTLRRVRGRTADRRR